jgi:hypothetical protein
MGFGSQMFQKKFKSNMIGGRPSNIMPANFVLLDYSIQTQNSKNALNISNIDQRS